MSYWGDKYNNHDVYGMVAEIIKEISETFFRAKLILSEKHSDLRHLLNIAMSLIRTLAYMEIHSLKKVLPQEYWKIYRTYESILDRAESKVFHVKGEDRDVLYRLIGFLKNNKYRNFVALMMEKDKD